MDYSKLLGRIRERALTQAEVAQKIGVSPATLNKMRNFIDGFHAWWSTRNIKPHRLTMDEFAVLQKAIAFESKIRSIVRFVWRIFIDLCAIIAAVFGVLAYFKQ